jgi:hypothetical protein
VTFATLFDRPTPLEGDHGMRNWVKTFRSNTIDRIPENVRERFLERIERHTRDALRNEHGWFADYRRIRVVARKGR